MENKFLDKVTRSLSTEMPYNETMDGYLDEILKSARALSEDLREENFYVNKPWLEFRDDENFHDSILHFFNEEEEYLRSINGDVMEGTWRFLRSSNKMLISVGGENELYDLAYLDPEFFILSKHGDQQRLRRDKYFVMVFERVAKRLEWRDIMEMLYNKYRNSNTFYYFLAFMIVLIVVLFILLSQ